MNTEASFTLIAPLIFYNINYRGWVIRIEAYLDIINVREVVRYDYEIPPVPNNPTMTKIKNHKDRKQHQKSKLAYS